MEIKNGYLVDSKRIINLKEIVSVEKSDNILFIRLHNDFQTIITNTEDATKLFEKIKEHLLK